jgi:SAM-dependent methyltransferase
MSSSGITPGGLDRIRGDLFDSQAEAYDRFRPGYPNKLFSLLAEVAGLQPGDQVVEIGPGTGQLTLPLVERGYDVTAVEPGAQLATILRGKLLDYDNATVLEGRFEDVDLPENTFQLVVGATSLHWVDGGGGVLFDKSHRLLRDGGYLVAIYNELVALPSDRRFFEAIEPVVRDHDMIGVLRAGLTTPTAPEGRLVKGRNDLQPKYTTVPETFEAGPYFVQKPTTKIYETTDEYLEYLKTMSPVLDADPAEREAFLDEMRAIVDGHFGGQVSLHFAATLQPMRKK